MQLRGGRSFAEAYLDPELADEVLRASKSGGRSKDPFYKFVHAMEKVNALKTDLPAGIENRIRNLKELRRSTRLRHRTPTDLSIDPVVPGSGIFHCTTPLPSLESDTTGIPATNGMNIATREALGKSSLYPTFA